MLFKAQVSENKKISIHNKVAFAAYVGSFDVGTILDVEISKEKKRRTPSQNNTIWLMAEKLDKLFMGYNDKNKARWDILLHVGHFDVYEINGEQVKLPRGTSKMSKDDFKDLLESIIRFGITEYQYDLTPITRGY